VRSLVRLIGLITALAVVGSAPAVSQGRSVGLVRDAEIENIIRDYATPIFNAAGLDTTSVRIHLVNDERLNAFVAGGQRMFINTGLLMRASHPEEVIGVIAHEAGHIAGGHLARFQDELRNARTTSILSMILGTAAGLAARDGRVAGAVISGSNQALLRDLLKYSRTQESAADAAALKYLDQTGISARGLLEFFELLQRDVRLSGGREHPYLSTHPLTNDRMAAVSSHLALSRFADAGPSPDLARKHAYMRAKLIGFTEPLERTLEIYGDDDQSAPARYARATAYYLQSDLDRALPLIDGLIVEEPENPYFYELKGQMLLENGRVAESIVPYQRMVDLAPDEALLRMALAKAQVETGDKTLLSPALEHLQATVRLEPDLQGAWRLLTVVQGRLGNQGELALAQAEYALLGDDPKAAKAHAERAIELLPTGAPGWLRSQDIVSEADRQIEER
jgi:predicted Zn-dependent protease